MNPMSVSPDLDSDRAHRASRGRAIKARGKSFFYACYPKVIRVVRRKLDRPMRTLYDSTDFYSDVMKSLVANLDRFDFPSIESLIAFLKKAAEQKVIDEYRRQHARKRGIDRNRPLVADDGTDMGPLTLPSPGPTASQEAQATEALDRLLAEHQDLGERQVIELKQQGYTNPEIAEQTGWNLRKVQRFFKDLYDTLFNEGGKP